MRDKDLDLGPDVSPADKSAMGRLRLLDFDDLYLLSHLLTGITIAATAKQLGLTQPAITQRVRKIERAFGETILQKVGRHARLTKEGHAICTKAADALAVMRSVATEAAPKSLTIGASPTAGTTWLWNLIASEREGRSAAPVNIYVGAPEELASMLEAGTIDALLTAEPYAGGVFAATDLGDEDYVLVARTDLAEKIAKPEDLAKVHLLELDRAYPLLERVASRSRPALRFRDVWFLGAMSNVLSALAHGFGVALLPESSARPSIEAGKLALVLPEIEITPERYRLLYRRDRASEPHLASLINRLQARR